MSSRRILVLQALVLSVAFSAVLALLTYYGQPGAIFRNRLVAALWGLFLGIPAAIGLLLRTTSRSWNDG